MAVTPTPDTLLKMLRELHRRVDDLEDTSPLAAGSATAGTTRWKDGNATDQIIVGLESDGTYAVWIGAVKIQATGPNANSILGLVALTLSGLLTANGGISVPDHNLSTNVPTLGGGTGAKVWVQSTDPGGAASNGDVWFDA